MAIRAAGISVSWREILLKDKPQAMLDSSPKGTVPVLVLENGTVIDESRDVMQWALSQSAELSFDPNWEQSDPWLTENDEQFKYWLDRYKYSVGYPEHTEQYYRDQAEQFIAKLDQQLACQPFLLGQSISAADIGIFSFVRQFAYVDQQWFFSNQYHNVQRWLNYWLEHPWFTSVMHKQAPWQPGDKEILL